MKLFNNLIIATRIFFLFSTPLTVCEELPWCSNNNHTTGSWVKHADNTNIKKSFVCCGGAQRDSLGSPLDLERVPGFCHPSNTVSTFFERGYTEYGSQCGDDCCRCDREDDTRLIPNKREAYYWSPTSCRLQEWNATLFCELLGSRTILLMGDSTMQETASTIMSMISANKGTCAPQLFFSRSDFVGFKARGHSSIQTIVAELQPSIAIITFGAHLEDKGDFVDISNRIDSFLQSRIASNLSVPTMVWKTQNPPHLGCEEILDPLLIDVSNTTVYDKYNFKIIREHDEFMRGYIVSNYSYYSLLDMYPLYLRADAHILGGRNDCMHYCVPGPLNIFSIILLQMLFNKEI